MVAPQQGMPSDCAPHIHEWLCSSLLVSSASAFMGHWIKTSGPCSFLCNPNPFLANPLQILPLVGTQLLLIWQSSSHHVLEDGKAFWNMQSIQSAFYLSSFSIHLDSCKDTFSYKWDPNLSWLICCSFFNIRWIEVFHCSHHHLLIVAIWGYTS